MVAVSRPLLDPRRRQGVVIEFARLDEVADLGAGGIEGGLPGIGDGNRLGQHQLVLQRRCGVMQAVALAKSPSLEVIGNEAIRLRDSPTMAGTGKAVPA